MQPKQLVNMRLDIDFVPLHNILLYIDIGNPLEQKMHNKFVNRFPKIHFIQHKLSVFIMFNAINGSY